MGDGAHVPAHGQSGLMMHMNIEPDYFAPFSGRARAGARKRLEGLLLRFVD